MAIQNIVPINRLLGGEAGKLIIPVGSGTDYGRSVIQQADGKLVVAGSSENGSGSTMDSDFSLIRLNRDGSLDSSFGSGGKLIMPVGQSFDYGQSVIQQADGKLVVAGHSSVSLQDTEFSLIRLNSNGSLDSSFASGGKLLMSVGTNRSNSIGSVIQQSDGKLVVAGSSYNNSNADYDFSLIRLNRDGSLDSNFGSGGNILIDVGGIDIGKSVIQQSDGKLLVAGYSVTGPFMETDISLIRLNRDGSLDTSFGSGGKLIVDAGSGSDLGSSVIQQSDGKLVVAGPSGGAFSLIRLNTDGSLDSSFGAAGKLIVPFGPNSDSAYSVIQQSDGKLMVAGIRSNSVEKDFRLIRLNTDGSVDSSFGSGGKLVVPVGSSYDDARSVIRQSDGKLVVAGSSYNNSNADYDFSLIRLNPDGSLDTTFGQSNGNNPSDQWYGDAGGLVTDDYHRGGDGDSSLYGLGGRDELLGGKGNDSLYGGDGDDVLHGQADNDLLDGGAGRDSAIFSGARSNYNVARMADGFTVSDFTGLDGTDTLTGIERLKFSNLSVALDTDGAAGQAYRLYKAAFDRIPDLGGLGYWIHARDNGTSLQKVALGFIGSQEFQQLYGVNASNQTFITKLYNNVLDRNPDQGGYDFWLGQMSRGMSREDVLVNFSESAENIANVATLIGTGIPFQEWTA